MIGILSFLEMKASIMLWTKIFGKAQKTLCKGILNADISNKVLWMVSLRPENSWKHFSRGKQVIKMNFPMIFQKDKAPLSAEADISPKGKIIRTRKLNK